MKTTNTCNYLYSHLTNWLLFFLMVCPREKEMESRKRKELFLVIFLLTDVHILYGPFSPEKVCFSSQVCFVWMEIYQYCLWVWHFVSTVKPRSPFNDKSRSISITSNLFLHALSPLFLYIFLSFCVFFVSILSFQNILIQNILIQNIFLPPFVRRKSAAYR